MVAACDIYSYDSGIHLIAKQGRRFKGRNRGVWPWVTVTQGQPINHNVAHAQGSLDVHLLLFPFVLPCFTCEGETPTMENLSSLWFWVRKPREQRKAHMKKNIGSDRRPVRCFVSTTTGMCDFLKFPSCLHDRYVFSTLATGGWSRPQLWSWHELQCTGCSGNEGSWRTEKTGWHTTGDQVPAGQTFETTSWYAVWLYVANFKPGDIINFWWPCARRKKLWRSFSLPWWAKPENFAIWFVTSRRATVIPLQQRTLTINSGNTLHYPGVLHLATLQAIPVQTPTSVLASGPCSSLAFPRCVKTLETHIGDVDKHYDLCNESWAKGEVEDFSSDGYLGWLKLYINALQIPNRILFYDFCF